MPQRTQLPLLALALALTAAGGGSWQPQCSLGRSSGASWLLDCGANATLRLRSDTGATRRSFVAVAAAGGRVTWRLSPELLGNEEVNELAPFDSAPDAWPGEASLLVLSRLRQREFSLSPLLGRSSLRHLAIEASNVSCLRRGDFAPVGRLRSLRLLGNRRLRCLQRGAMSELSQLQRLLLADSPRLVSLHPAALSPSLQSLTLRSAERLRLSDANFCQLRRLRRLQLDAEVGGSQLLGLRRLRQLRVAGDSLSAVVQLRSFVCSHPRPSSLSVNGDSPQQLVAGQLSMSMPEFCDGVDAGRQRRLAEEECQRPVADCGACDTVTTTPAPASASASASDDEQRPQRRQSAAASVDEQRAAAAKESPNRLQSFWQRERQNATGTVLLVAGAFAAGVLLSLYCFSGRRAAKPDASVRLLSVSAQMPSGASVRFSEPPDAAQLQQAPFVLPSS